VLRLTTKQRTPLATTPAVLLAVIDFPDFSGPLRRVVNSVEKIANDEAHRRSRI